MFESFEWTESQSGAYLRRHIRGVGATQRFQTYQERLRPVLELSLKGYLAEYTVKDLVYMSLQYHIVYYNVFIIWLVLFRLATER